jgi:protein-S-isoprenylcysteine O-methyltransferase Ste14
LTDTVVTRANATLVTTGPYRWIRHPFYVTVVLLVVAVTLLAANWFVGLCGLVIFVSQVIRLPIEEQRLIEKFGDEYRAYLARTGRFLPKLWSKQ